MFCYVMLKRPNLETVEKISLKENFRTSNFENNFLVFKNFTRFSTPNSNFFEHFGLKLGKSGERGPERMKL